MPECWDYAKEFETQISLCVLKVLGGQLVGRSEGFDPTKDVTWNINTEGLVDVEIKASAGRTGFIEVGRFNYEESGLSATKSHVYMHLSVDNPKPWLLSHRERKVKVRLYATHRLVDEYLAAKGTWRMSAYEPDENGPGSRGFTIDSRQVFHCYVGDLRGWVNDNGQVEYNLDEWLHINRSAGTEFSSIMRGVRKNDPHYEYETEDSE